MIKRIRLSSRSLPFLLVNILLLAASFLMIGRYVSIYQDKLWEENLSNISNLNQSAANNATALMNSWRIKLEDVSGFAERRRMTSDELLVLLEETNSSDMRQFQLIGADGTGYLARRDASGAFIPLSYQNDSYADLLAIFSAGQTAADNAVRFAPEFTDQYTALKHFALYRHVRLADSAGDQVYTLLLGGRSFDMLGAFNPQGALEGLSSVLIDSKGNYIISNNDFKSNNFFQYLYVYNDLSLDKRNALNDEINAKGYGELFFKNAEGRECVFRYARMTTDDWYCVTCVPLSSFRSASLSSNYAIYSVFAVLLLLAVDILWMRGMNRRLRVSIQREKEASEAKTDFLSRMSHDIRTPLNGVIGLTLLAADEANPPATAEYLGHIKSCGEFLLGLVNDILDLSKVESGKMALRPERYDGAEFRRYISAVIAPLCREKNQTLTVTPAGDQRPVMLDRLRFNQIFFNLLSNAVKYTPAGGHVEISWTKADLPGGRVAFRFVVRDDGIGMSEEFQKHMFESFSQERSIATAQGSGLGLAIVWNLVKLMGGSITVESKQGEGSAFFVYLETDLCLEEAAAPAPVDLSALRGKRVLLCEDNDLNAMIANRLLGKWEITVDHAANGRIGVERFIASPPGEYDAVLMDIQMPEMNGLEAARAIRALSRPDAATVPIIAMTANTYVTDMQNCLNAGMNAHMGKPLQPEILRDMLVRFLCAPE